jgi:hypothetical protein
MFNIELNSSNILKDLQELGVVFNHENIAYIDEEEFADNVKSLGSIFTRNLTGIDGCEIFFNKSGEVVIKYQHTIIGQFALNLHLNRSIKSIVNSLHLYLTAENFISTANISHVSVEVYDGKTQFKKFIFHSLLRISKDSTVEGLREFLSKESTEGFYTMGSSIVQICQRRLNAAQADEERQWLKTLLSIITRISPTNKDFEKFSEVLSLLSDTYNPEQKKDYNEIARLFNIILEDKKIKRMDSF